MPSDTEGSAILLSQILQTPLPKQQEIASGAFRTPIPYRLRNRAAAAIAAVVAASFVGF